MLSRISRVLLNSSIASREVLASARTVPKNVAFFAEVPSPQGMPGSATGGPASDMLRAAADAQMQKIKASLNAPSEAPATPSVLRKALGAVVYGVAGMAGLAGYYYYRYETRELEQMVHETKTKPENAFPGSTVWVEVMGKFVDWRKNIDKKVKEYTDPTVDKLLPDMQPELVGKVKTLVLDLDDLLVHKEWTRQKGWNIFKRPGVSDFIFDMAHYFEIVVYTDEPNTYADPILNKLDTHRAIPYRLYRPETQFTSDGKHVRDLSKLNRDLSQVLFISADPDAYAFQPENTLKLKRWTGDAKDTTLLDLLPFLQMIAMRGVKDVRDVVRSYDHEEDVAKAFKMRAAQLAEKQKAPKQRGILPLQGSQH